MQLVPMTMAVRTLRCRQIGLRATRNRPFLLAGCDERLYALLHSFARCLPHYKKGFVAKGNTSVADSPVRHCNTAKMMRRRVSSRRFLYSPLFLHYRTYIYCPHTSTTRPSTTGLELANDNIRALTLIGNANIFFKNPRKAREHTNISGARETTSALFLHPTAGFSIKLKQCLRTFYGVT